MNEFLTFVMERLGLSFGDLWKTAVDAGAEGVAVCVVVLLVVYFLAFTDLLNRPALKRGAAIIAAGLFSDVAEGELRNVFIMAISLALSTLAKLLIDKFVKYLSDLKKQLVQPEPKRKYK